METFVMIIPKLNQNLYPHAWPGDDKCNIDMYTYKQLSSHSLASVFKGRIFMVFELHVTPFTITTSPINVVA